MNRGTFVDPVAVCDVDEKDLDAVIGGTGSLCHCNSIKYWQVLANGEVTDVAVQA